MIFQSSACMLSTPNQVYSFVHAYHRAISWWFHKRLPFCTIGACVSLISSKYPTCCWSTFQSCHYDLTCDFVYLSCSIIQENIVFYSTNDRSSWEFENVIFDFKHPLELLDQEEQVRKRNTSRVMKHNLILQGTMSPMHGRKSCMRDWEVLLCSIVPKSSVLHGQCVLHHFIVLPPLINLGTRFLLRGEGCNTPCHSYPNCCH
jgi:hypothetical protein